MVNKSSVSIGGGQGFYGDGLAPLADLLNVGLDYLIFEGLAELTLAILQKDRLRDESLGYTRDLPLYLANAQEVLIGRRTKVVTNAGGINPIAAGRVAVETLRSLGGNGLKVATVVGDDVLSRPDDFALEQDLLFANVYLGALPIVQALQSGADIVLTGRVADASLFLAPLIYEFCWDFTDYDRLASGVVVGHLLECSGQVAGGNYSGAWWENKNPDRIGFPYCDVEPNGQAIISKPKDTGGRVTFDTVREQLLYEVHDPSSYLNPDVTCDFTSVTLEDLGEDRVLIEPSLGGPPPTTYKGLACKPNGFSCEVKLGYAWPDAEAKARIAIRYIKNRAQAIGVEVLEWWEEYFGVNGYGGPTVEIDPLYEPPEVIGRLAWRCAQPAQAQALFREVGVLGLSGPPGFASIGRARDGKPTQLLKVTQFAANRSKVDPYVKIEITEV